jgi:3-hydroxy-D-aspartate aldolase
MPTPTAINDPTLASVLEAKEVTFSNGGDEHGVLRGLPAGVLPVGSTLQLVPSHCDPTVNLHDWLVGVRDGVVEELWAVDARGNAYG